jgi:hypothetical protein
LFKKKKEKLPFDYDLYNSLISNIDLVQKKRAWSFIHSRNGIKLLGKVPFKFYFKWVKMPLLFDFFRWVLIDWWKESQKHNLFGIYMFCGLFGEGKTISMCHFAQEKQRADPSIRIFSNFNYKYQSGEVNSIQDILDIEGTKIIIMLDEIQNTFSNSKWQDFPISVLAMITQCRKRQLMLLCTAQVYRRVTPQIRELVQYVVQCSNVLGANRLFYNLFYNSETYEQYLSAVGTGNKKKIQPTMRRLYVADDLIYNLYNTKEVVENLTDTFDVFITEKDYKDYKVYRDKYYKGLVKIPNFESNVYADFKYYQQKRKEA